MRYIELFAGIGGFRYGIDRAFDHFSRTRIQQGWIEKIMSMFGNKQLGKKPLCVYANEWDTYANSVYRRHYGECDITDIRKVDASSIPDFHLLTGGFPCQSFSIAGRRAGFDDTRGTLFFEICRIIRAKQPSLLLLENVKGLLSHEEGRTFGTIISTLDELGYDLQWQVLNSKDFGVPQNRERVFIIGNLRGTPRPEVFPLGTSEEKTASYVGSGIVQLNNPTHSNDRVFGPNGISPTLNTMQGGRRQPKVLMEDKIRRFTPVECERLQGFPDNWTKMGFDGGMDVPISDTQRYKMCGNAVTTNAVSAIFYSLLKQL